MFTSVIMPAFNAERFIGRAIASVVSQTYTNWELIVVDDASIDRTSDIVQGWVKNDGRIRYIRLANNQGAAAARNIATEEARGNILSFLDSDDEWIPAKLDIQLSEMAQERALFTFGAYYTIDELGRRISTVSVPPSITYDKLLRTSPIACLTVAYNAGAIGKHYSPDIRLRNDYCLWLSVLRCIGERASKDAGVYTVGIGVPLGLYRLRKKSLSSNKVRAAYYQWRVYREIERLSFYKSTRLFTTYAVRGAMRAFEQRRSAARSACVPQG